MKPTWVWQVENSRHPKPIKSRAHSLSALACFDSCTLSDWALAMTVRCQALGCWDGDTWTSCTLRELLRLQTHTLFPQRLPRCRNSPGHLICWRAWHGFRYTAEHPERWDGSVKDGRRWLRCFSSPFVVCLVRHDSRLHKHLKDTPSYFY